MKFHDKRAAIRVTIFYTLFAGLWITYSDRLVALLFPTPEMMLAISTLKGLAFTVITALLIYILTAGEFSRQQANQQAVRDSEEKFRALFEHSRDANFILSQAGFVDCNLSAVKLLGADDKREIIGKRPLDFSPERQPDGSSSRERSEALIQAALNEGSQHFDWQYVRLDGRAIQVDVTLTAITTGQKRVLFGVYRDLTPRLEAEAALRFSEMELREREQQYRLLFQYTPAGILHYDLDAYVTACNDRLIEILKSSRQRVIGQNLRLLRDTSLLPAIEAPLEGRQGAYEGHYAATTSDVEVWVYLRTAPVYDQKGSISGGVAILEDMTERRKAEIEAQLAYESSLEGWARALELRDRETEGHSRRVTDLTVRLAREMGILDEELIHVRRGALLHDVGKLGVPDVILLKPDNLTPDERKVMSQHPTHAYRMLRDIPYLEKAIEIPYCHHEKWDGTGYPRGLKGTEIPLSARIFAVVDVYDALLHDRPYRPAWPEYAVIQYIKDESGSHFDPQIVDGFMRIIEALQPESSEQMG